jgi:hypothetical protein
MARAEPDLGRNARDGIHRFFLPMQCLLCGRRDKIREWMNTSIRIVVAIGGRDRRE